jgi:DNA end-binding protein Ku
MATGTISFVLVSIPVKLYSTTVTGSRIGLNWINPETGSRVKMKHWDPSTEELAERDQLVKGYEFAKGQYVIFTEEELEEVLFKATHSIDIKEFVPLEQVDPIHFEKAYYLGSNVGGERPYQLLATVMREKNRAALAMYAARGKNYLVLLRPFENGLMMQQLRYSSEIREFVDIEVGDVEIDSTELALAEQIVDQIRTTTSNPRSITTRRSSGSRESSARRSKARRSAPPRKKRPRVRLST